MTCWSGSSASWNCPPVRSRRTVLPRKERPRRRPRPAPTDVAGALRRSARARPADCRPELRCNRSADAEGPAQHHVVDGLVDLELAGRVTGAHPELRLTGTLGG